MAPDGSVPLAGLEGPIPGGRRMAILDNATHALLIDGEDAAQAGRVSR